MAEDPIIALMTFFATIIVSTIFVLIVFISEGQVSNKQNEQ